MLKHNKRKILVFSLLAMFLLIPFGYDVFAETPEEKITKHKDTCVPELLINKYKLSIETVEGTVNQYRIYVNGEDAGDAQFRVTKVEAGTLLTDVSTAVIKKGQDLYLNIESGDVDGRKGVKVEVSLINTIDGCLGIDDEAYAADVAEKDLSTFHITLTQSSLGGGMTSIYHGEETVPNPHVGEGQICTNFINGIYNTDQFNKDTVIKKEDFEGYGYAAVGADGKAFYQELIPYCFNAQVNKSAVYDDVEVVKMIGNAITIWKSYSTPMAGGTQSFNDAFAQIRDAAIAAGVNVGTLTTPAAKDTKLSYTNKCDYNQTTRAEKNYYSAQLVDSQTVEYTYNYAPGAEEKETKTVCNKVCEEAVKVEYGPPVASKAGLCFDYTVKVTSYVKCSADIIPDSKPKVNHQLCDPLGYCKSIYGTLRKHPRAGPTDEFDDCVQECDGGKYTQECSLKCYKKVYKNAKNLKVNYTDILNAKGKKVSYTTEQCLEDNPDGCFVRSGGSLFWKEVNQTKGFDTTMLARVYPETDYWMVTSKAYIVNTNGFMVRVYANGQECDDICWWDANSCPTNSYLNAGSIAKDNESNLALYNSAVSACKAAATCSKKTATYTIAVKYDTKNEKAETTVNKVYYPYTSASQHKQNPTENANEYNTIAKDTFTDGVGYKNDLSTIIDYNGCYSSVDNKKWYLTEWGFPGTYINNKTGEISFGEPSDMSGWYLENKKFCAPLNAETVNPKWWEWKVIGNHCITEDAILQELQGKAGTSNGYNIEAIAKDFGYFGWDFKVSCFYGIRNEVCDTSESVNACCPGGGGGTGEPDPETAGYTFRAIDTRNIFPNSGHNVPDDQRRAIGFNWTAGASILSAKNEQYRVNPEELKEQIEKNADSIYQEEPDYQFHLTPQDLSTLRRYNDRYSYTAWNGEVKVINGISAYHSNLFRTAGIESNVLDGDTIKYVGEPGVNNE